MEVLTDLPSLMAQILAPIANDRNQLLVALISVDELPRRKYIDAIDHGTHSAKYAIFCVIFSGSARTQNAHTWHRAMEGSIKGYRIFTSRYVFHKGLNI